MIHIMGELHSPAGGPQNDGLEKALKKWQLLVSMLDFWGVYVITLFMEYLS